MSESPEAIREQVLKDELAKGSDPRVAEARAKAAAARAEQGLPIDPQEAWPLKLERAGKQVSAPASPPPATEAVEAPPAPEPEPEPAPAPEPAPEPAAAPVPEPVAVAPVEVPVPFDPEVGEPIEQDDESITVVGGIEVRDSRIPAWLVAVLVLIPLWAAFYLVAIGQGDVERTTTGCVVHDDRTFECFQPAEGSGSDAGSGGH